MNYTRVDRTLKQVGHYVMLRLVSLLGIHLDNQLACPRCSQLGSPVASHPGNLRVSHLADLPDSPAASHLANLPDSPVASHLANRLGSLLHNLQVSPRASHPWFQLANPVVNLRANLQCNLRANLPGNLQGNLLAFQLANLQVLRLVLLHSC